MNRLLLLALFLCTFTFGYAQISISESMDSGIPAGWSNSGYFSNTSVTSCEGTAHVRDNLWSSSTTGSITTSNQVGASNGTDVSVSYDWQTTEFGAGDGVGLSADVEYSTNDGVSWISLGNYTTTAIETCTNFSATILAVDIPTGSDFKFRITGNYTAGDFYHYVDNIQISQVSSSPPNCDAALTSPTTDFPLNGTLTWSPATGIPTGYFVTIGSSSGGTDIANMVDVGLTTSYVPSGLMYSATYFVTITPYNGNGNATGCIEESFTVEADPTITVTCGTPTNQTYCYGNNDNSQFLYVASDGTSQLTISFNAGGIEGCCDNIFIYDGASTGDPLLFSGSNGGDLSGLTFTSTGTSLLLVVDSDGSVSCASGSGCCTTSWDWDVECATCTPPSFTLAEGSNNCPASEIFIDVTITGLGDATTVNILNDGGAAAVNGVDGTAPTYQIGPFAEGAVVTVTVEDAADATCNSDQAITLGNCPPSNDLCADAISTGVGTVGGTTVDATTADEPGFCGTAPDAPGVWYSYTSTGPEEITIDICGAPYDSKINIFDGSCGALNCITGEDDDFTNCGENDPSVTFPSTANIAPVTYYIYVNGFGNQTGTFDLTIASAPLPIELIAFSGEVMKAGNKISWSTASEIGVEAHVVERSHNGYDSWREIGRIDSPGDVNSVSDYEIMDENPLAKSYYRLRTIDYDRSVQKSEVINLTREADGFIMTNAFPNPTRDLVNVQFHSPVNTNIAIEVTDITGKIVQHFEIDAQDGINTLELNLSNVSAGTYFLSMSTETDRLVERVVKH